MSDESKAGPPDSGPKQDQVSIWKCLESNAQVLKRLSPTAFRPFKSLEEGKCILEWTEVDVKTWLSAKNYAPGFVSALDDTDGSVLATLTLDMMDDINATPRLKKGLLKRVEFLLRKQQKKNFFEDYDEYESIMDTRGNQCFDCHICTHLEHVKRNLIVFFCQFFFQTLGETEFLRNASATRYMQFWFKC